MKASYKIKFLIKACFKLSPSFIFIVIIGTIFNTISLLGNLIIPKYLVEEIVVIIQNKNYIIDQSNFNFIDYINNYNKIFLIVAILIGFNILMSFILKTYNRINDVKIRDMNFRFPSLLADKIMQVPYEYLEDPYYLDLKERALFALNNQSAFSSLVYSLVNTLRDLIAIISLIILVCTLSYIVIIIILVLSGLFIIIYLFSKKYQVKFFQGLIPINRKYGYYIDVCTSNTTAKDIRLYQGSSLLSTKVYEYNKKIMDEFDIFYKKMGLMVGYSKILNAIQTALIYGYVALRVIGKIGKKITLGDFTMYTSSSLELGNKIASILSNIVDVIATLDYLDPFIEFMQLKEESLSKYKYEFKGEINSIRFENVSFKYPKSDKYVLQDLTFSIKKGEKISIVGLNGAGKTTLIKLLCRLYHPTSGKIYVNDIDIFDYEFNSYNKSISAVFQDFKIFAYNVRENIIGTLEYDEKKLDRIINQIGIKEKIESLPKGLDTLLSKEYDEEATELSGGQGQKIAIARSLYKDASLIILDEPTSALDPISEADIYQNFNTLVENKTAIYISHRMSSSVFCDKILIIDGGRIIDYAPHLELMKNKDSLYYKMFHVQAKSYQI